MMITFPPFAVHSKKMTKKKPRFGAVPVLNMPKRSHETTKPITRPERSVVKDVEEPVNNSCYKTFEDFCQRVKSLKSLSEWSSKLLADRVVFKKIVEPYLLPELEIIVDVSLGFTVKVFGSYLMEDHPLYLEYRRTVQNVTLSTLVKNLEDCTMCRGVNTTEVTSKLYHHVIPVSHDSMQDSDEQQFPHRGFWRARGCWLLCEQEDTSNVCHACSEYLISANKSRKGRENRLLKPARQGTNIQNRPRKNKVDITGTKVKVCTA